MNKKTPMSLEDFEAWAREIGHYQTVAAIERYRKFKGHNKAEAPINMTRVEGTGTG